MSKHMAHIEHDWMRDGVQIALVADEGGHDRTLYDFSGVTGRHYRVEDGVAHSADDARLALPQDAARALYEALAAYFGHVGHDAAALRKDYDAERARVDVFIKHLTSGPTR